MRIGSLPQFFRNVKRWTDILSVLSKYGLADWLSGTNIEFIKSRLKHRDGEVLTHFTREARIRLVLTELGPTFIKLGQLLSTRPDVVGEELASELSQLQASTPADPPQLIRDLITRELGQPIEEVFEEFDDLPIASASIGQVHLARLRTGERVVVKVQHADIESVVNEDLDVLAGLAQLAESIPEFAPYRPTATVAEMARTLRRELDFGREERSLQQFGEMFALEPTVRIPRAYTELCTPRVLTMDYIDGTRLTETGRLLAEGIDLEQIARRGARLYMDMIFIHGFYHADPHPGNLLILPGNVIGLLDFGMVGRLEERMREDIEEMLLAITNHDVPMLVTVIKRLGNVPPHLDEAGLSNDVADFVGHYSTQALDRFDLSGALRDVTQIIRRYHIQLPPQVALLIKVLVTLEGTTQLLTPRFSLMEVMQPYHRKMLLRRFSPARQWRKLRRLYLEVEQVVEVLPRRILQLFEQMQEGKFDVHLDHRGLSPSVNRLVAGMLASALFLGSSLMLSQQVPPLLFRQEVWLGMKDLSILGLTGCTIAVLMGLRLFLAIMKSGHLDQKSGRD
jgi:ubiquinone biosynthesis protein